ncbi:MAG: response regulator [Actinobacteria bacterium]|nr:response regulator [Actinomycetota bacterium]
MIRILIAEDDPAVATMLEMTFALEGYTTEVVTDGAAAVDRLAGAPVDVVVLDVMMPGVDGLEVLRRLRGDAAWDGTRVIVSTALASDADVWAGWSAGADYYLTKPFDLDHLREVVSRMALGVPVT